MTPQEAIEIIESNFRNCSIAEDQEATSMAINSLEKQIPKKPDYEGDGYDDNGNLLYDTWICPCCETQYELYYDEYKFCPKCGQAIDLNMEK